MVLHLFLIKKIFKSSHVSSYSHIYIKNKYDGLDSDKQPKFIMIKFSNAASYPETMMIIFLNTSIAIITVLCPIRKFFYSTYFAFSIFWNLKFSYIFKIWLILNFLLNFIFLRLFISLR